MNPKQVFISSLFISMFLSGQLYANPLGDGRAEFWISGLADVQLGNSPSNPHAAVDSRGREIYVWDDTTYNPSTQAPNVVMRILDTDGTTVRGPVQINTYDTSSQRYPRVAVSANNTFVVAWESLEGNPLRTMIRSQAFDVNGQPAGTEQVVNTTITNLPGGQFLDITPLVGGGYVAVWQSGAAGADAGVSIQGRLFGANGVPSGSQFQVSTISGDYEGDSAVAPLNDGGFVAAWTYTEVWARRFNSTGSPLTDRFQVNTTTSGNESDTSLAKHADGRIAIVWRDGGDTTDPLTAGIRGRIYSSTLAALGNDFQINSLTAGQQYHPGVADYAENGFFVVWESATTAGDDAAPDSIQGRIITGNNEFGTAQFQVNQWTAKSQEIPTVGGRNGRVATAWTSLGTQDFVNLPVIKSRSWSICGIFCDGFE